MKNYQPDYYNNFKCIADKCSITCCQEWKIAVDDATNRKWKKLSADKVSGKSDNLSSYTCHKDGSLVIKLDEKHRCPFLSKDKLCHLVMTYSDEVLSETCALFPREIHRFSTHEERTLMPCCPAVIDLISPEAASTKKIIEHMIIKMQWIMIEYTAIRQSLFLWYSHNANSPLTYETIREHIVIISRMTGYDDDDIREYLENSFAKLIWDWGYAALIMGIRK